MDVDLPWVKKSLLIPSPISPTFAKAMYEAVVTVW